MAEPLSEGLRLQPEKTGGRPFHTTEQAFPRLSYAPGVLARDFRAGSELLQFIQVVEITQCLPELFQLGKAPLVSGLQKSQLMKVMNNELPCLVQCLRLFALQPLPQKLAGL
ncbi:MAG: hypothetical protein WCJ41_21755, partial [Aestuariivirga sp.]|uniref:hypothetical protein n=1 Tax=Aestuariivirga sp. TaxID=2650926 RepID=UPI003019F2CB